MLDPQRTPGVAITSRDYAMTHSSYTKIKCVGIRIVSISVFRTWDRTCHVINVVSLTTNATTRNIGIIIYSFRKPNSFLYCKKGGLTDRLKILLVESFICRGQKQPHLKNAYNPTWYFLWKRSEYV